jgi:hypothetical protein
MKRCVAKHILFCIFMLTLLFASGCGGGGGGGSSEQPPSGVISSRPNSDTAGGGANNTNPNQQTDGKTYETPDPAILYGLIAGIGGIGSYVVLKRKRRE